MPENQVSEEDEIMLYYAYLCGCIVLRLGIASNKWPSLVRVDELSLMVEDNTR